MQFHDLVLLEGSRNAILSMTMGGRRAMYGPEALSAIVAPTLVIHGEEDNIINVKRSFIFKEKIKNVKFKIYPKIGHLPMYEDPVRTASDIKNSFETFNLKVNKSITLIGMAGAGKSTIGKQLAKLLDFNFLDGDLIIEERINQSIQNFLDQHGGKEFTKIEEEVLLSINFDKTILATGGSAVLSDNAMQFLRKESEVIFLDVTYENISKRILNLSERGLVREPNQSLQETYDERLSLYRKYADHIVINDGDIDSCFKTISCFNKKFLIFVNLFFNTSLNWYSAIMKYAHREDIYDADTHMMERPDWIYEFADKDIREKLEPIVEGNEETLSMIDKAIDRFKDRQSSEEALNQGQGRIHGLET